MLRFIFSVLKILFSYADLYCIINNSVTHIVLKLWVHLTSLLLIILIQNIWSKIPLGETIVAV